ncbi:BTB/POZ domain-containing protein [Phanerochaete sordida]|uniref:BTB/POZ domain-containing protein n=1 Tax=Phanerochaete sordida TaxID=48140 RepID=A0A9P3G4Z4_9APHY|nr:BTB/POZ domain-containing protein [Phanerochaete sordida]
MSSSTSTPQHPQGKKRKLADGAAGSGAPTALIRDERVWFADGNVIVRAGPGCTGDGPVYGFRCHSSVLAARSPVFADMFQLPNAAGDRFEGAECVDLPDDAEDVRGLLRYLYGSIDMQPLIILRHADTLKVISGPLRLAAKYDMESVTRELVPVLERDWPLTYDAWVHAEKGVRLLHSDVPPGEQNHQDPAAAVRLAMDLRLRAVLPAAFYGLSGLATRRPLRARAHERWADGALLTPADVARLTIGRERVARYLQDTLFRSAEDEIHEIAEEVYHSRERERDDCAVNLAKWWARAHPTAAHMYSIGPLAALKELRDELESEVPDHDETFEHVCRACRRAFSGELEDEARTFWDKLPELFDLESLPFE